MAIYFTKKQWSKLLNGIAVKIMEKNKELSEADEMEDTSYLRASVGADASGRVITAQPEE